MAKKRSIAAVIRDDHEYRVPEHQRFIRDMEKAGLEIRHYDGRSWWAGPAVVVDDISDAMSVTRVPCQFDNMGRHFIVYPRANMGQP